MAVYYFRNTGNTSWNLATNWSTTDGGVGNGNIPTITDDAYFTSNSGNCTVATTNGICKTLIFAGVGAGNYSGTFTVNILLDIHGDLKFSPTMTLAGTTNIGLRATSTLTSAGLTIPYALLMGSASNITYTLADNWLVNAPVSIGSAGTSTINGNQMTINGNLNIGATLVTGTTNFILAGTGSFQGSGTIRNNVTINTAGTITIGASGALNLNYNTGTLTYIAGTVNMFSSSVRLICNASTTLNTNGILWSNITFRSGTMTLASDLSTGELRIDTGAVVINGAALNVYVGGNIIIGQDLSGSAGIILNGTGTWSVLTSSYFIRNNLTINSPTGTITFAPTTTSAALYYDTGTFTYIAGTVVTTNSLLYLGSCTLNISGITLANVSFNGTSTTTLSSNVNVSDSIRFAQNPSTLTFAGVGDIVPIGLIPIRVGNDNYITGAGNSTVTFKAGTVYNCSNLTLSFGGAAGIGYSNTINNVTFNVNGNLLMDYKNQSTSLMLGSSAQINMVGTGSIQQTLISGFGTAVLRLPLNINTAGTITFLGTVRYDTSTLTYTSGTVNATGSTLLSQANTTFNTNGMSWGNVTFAGAATMTLTSNMTVGGTLLIQTGAIVINGVSRTLYVGGSLTINQTTSGTATIELTGTGTWSSTGFNLSNNLIFNNGASSFTVSGLVYYITGTMTYTSGTIGTTGSTLAIGASATLNTNPISWVNFSVSNNATITMSSDLNITGTLTVTNGATFTSVSGSQLVTSGNFAPTHNVTSPLTSTITLPNVINIVNVSASISGNLNAAVVLTGPGINISGNLTVTANNYSYGLKGTAPLNMIGIGTIDSVNVSGGSIYCPININTTGTITLGTYFNTGSVLTYTQGTFVNNNSLVWIRTGTFDLIGFDNIFWNSDIRTGFDVFTPNYTLSSNLNCRSFNAGGVSTAIGPGVINCNSLSINNNVSGASNITNIFNTDVNVYGTATIGTGGSTFIIGTTAGKAINVYGDLVLSAPVTVYGDATVKMLGTGTITSVANFRQFDLIIDTPGNITIANILYWNTGTVITASKSIVYLRGNVTVAKSAGLYIGNRDCSFTNMHRIPWPTVTITSGQTITLNEFFSGTANYKTVVVPTATTNYNITFTDGFERTTKFVQISNCTLTKPNQLIVTGDCRAKGTNRGIRYTNQSPNGLAKNLAKTKPSMTFDTGGLVPDPNFIRLK